MKKFIRNVFLFLIIITLCFGGIIVLDFFIIGSQYEYNYQASLVDKVERLENIKEPKIILVGDSNLAFGMDSKKVEEALAMPVVNLGLHGGLGNAFHEEIAKLNINEGDVIVVCHSSFSDTDEIGDRALAWVTIDNHFALGKIVRPKDWAAMIAAWPNYIRNAMFLKMTNRGNVDDGGIYSRNAFNEYGDIVFKPEYGQMDVESFFAEKEIHIPQINDICVNRLNEYNGYITSHGGTMVVAGYPIAYGEYADFDAADFLVFYLELQEALDCEIISDYTDYFFPYSYFYNSHLHLTAEGTEARTDQLILDLGVWMSNKIGEK